MQNNNLIFNLVNIIQEGDNAYHDTTISKKGKDLLNFWVGEVLNIFLNAGIVIGKLSLPLDQTNGYFLKIQDNNLMICGNDNGNCFT